MHLFVSLLMRCRSIGRAASLMVPCGAQCWASIVRLSPRNLDCGVVAPYRCAKCAKSTKLSSEHEALRCGAATRTAQHPLRSDDKSR